jgi:1,4-alpha-glucan branching enzyme
MGYRAEKNGLDRPYSVYEVHLGSWKKKNNNEFLSYAELANDLVA